MVPDDALSSEVDALATRLASGPTIALGHIRRMAWAAAESSLEAQLNLEVELQRACTKTADHQEGVASFLEKRPAAFAGA